MDEYFVDTVVKLEECLRIIIIKMKENALQKQLIMNAKLDKKTLLDVRHEINKYLFVDAELLESQYLKNNKENFCYSELDNVF